VTTASLKDQLQKLVDHKVALVKDFASIKLRLNIDNQPISFAGDPVFQLTIDRTPRGTVREEWFRMFIPEHAEVHVICTDEAHQQIVLSVKEDANVFEQSPIALSSLKYINKKDEQEQFIQQFLDRMSRFTNEIVREDIFKRNNQWWITRRTPERKRHFLMGKDERQLFICQLPTLAKTIKEAHDSLKQPTVLLAEGRNKRVVRQGEWFFINPTGIQLEKIKVLLKNKKIDIKKGQNIGAIVADRMFVAGNPHVADEIIVIPSKFLARGWSVMETQIYVRGCVRHHDHKTVVLGDWKLCLRNTEVQDTSEAITGWID
jgi:hypothetical protein